jgi:WD40 repeat protein
MGPDFNDNWDSTHSSVVWRTRDWKEVKRLTFSNEAFFVSPKVRLYKSQLMAFESGFLGNGTIELWNQKSGRRVRGFSVREKPSQPASFSPDGKYFAFKNQAGYRFLHFFWEPEAVDEIALLDIESGLIIARLRDPKAVVTAFAFTKNGRQIISGSSDGGIRIWKLPPSQ